MQVYIVADGRKQKVKPDSRETGAIQNRIRDQKPQKVKLETVLEMLEAGQTIRPGSKEAGQQLFLLDFDNKGEQITPQEAISRARAAGVFPCFGYETFSSSNEKVRFRIAFCADEPITDEAERQAAVRFLESLFPGVTDPDCHGTLSRLFYGTNKQAFYKDFDACFKVSAIRAWMHENPKPEQPKGERRKQHTRTGNAEAIKQHDTAYLRRKLHAEPRQFDNPKEFFEFVRKGINLAQLLEVPEGTAFPCLFHEDKNPSASVFRTQEGVWRYKCHSGCIQGAIGTQQVIEKLGCFKNTQQVIKFIQDIYQVSIKETKQSQEQKAIINYIECVFSNTDVTEKFCDMCPTANQNTRYTADIFLKILLIARNSIYPYSEQSGDVIFYMSVRQLQKLAKRGNTNRVNQHLKTLIYHRMIDICIDEQVPPDLLQKVRSKEDPKHNPITFYRIPSWVLERLQEIEQAGIRWKANGYRIRAVSYEMFYRAEGAQIAKWLYPNTCEYQSRDGTTRQKKPSLKSDQAYTDIEQKLLDLIRTAGFCTEKQVLESPMELNPKQAERQLGKLLPEIMLANNLQKVRSNKTLKEQYKIPGSGYPCIIVPKPED